MTFHLQLDKTKKLNTSNLMLKNIEMIRSESPDYNPCLNCCSYFLSTLVERDSGFAFYRKRYVVKCKRVIEFQF